MFPENTPFFSISDQMFRIFVTWFEKLYKFFGKSLSTVLSDWFYDQGDLVGDTASVILNRLLSVEVGNIPLGDYSILAICFGVGLSFLITYAVIKWFLDIIL